MPIFSEHNYTSITVKVDQLTAPHHNDDIDDSMEIYVLDLIQLIKVQPSTGAAEAARAIRKRIKYGSTVGEQLRALQLLELMVLNSGPKIGPVLARDDKLLDVLKGIINGSGRTGISTPYDKEVQSRVRALARGWKVELDGMEGYKYMASLWQALPKAKKHREHSRSRSSNVFESSLDEESNRVPQRPTSPKPQRPTSPKPFSSPSTRIRRSNHRNRSFGESETNNEKNKKKKEKKYSRYADDEYKIPQINYKVEAPKIRSLIASCHTHTTALNNILLTISDDESPLLNKKASSEFDKCRSIRRKVLRYLQFVGAGDESTKKKETIEMDEEFLGSLIIANEQLVETFKKFDFACGYTEENPAPAYNSVDSDESYYTDDSSEEDEDDNDDENEFEEEREVESIAQRIGSSSISQVPVIKRSPPPRPSKPISLQPPKVISKTISTDTLNSDPFGDSNEVANAKSIYN